MKALGIALLLAATPALAADDVPAALEPYMTQDEWEAAGLDQLNPAELAQFQAWFVRTMRGAPPAAATAPAPAPASTPTSTPTPAASVIDRPGRTDEERLFGTEQLDDNIDEISARVVGTFTGWDGPTRIELENGQVWRTIGSTRFDTLGPMESPVVTISRGLFNSYRLKVEGYNRSVQVERIE